MPDPGTRSSVLDALPWRGATAEIWRGSMAILRLLPRVSSALSTWAVVLLAIGTVVPLAFTVVTGRVVGLVPAAAAGGAGSPAAGALTRALYVAAVLFVLSQVIPGVRTGVVAALGRRLDHRMAQRVMDASLRPVGVRHLEDPAVLDRVSLAMGLGTGSTAGEAVQGMAAIAHIRLQALGATVLVGIHFHWVAGAVLFATSIGYRAWLKEPLRKSFLMMAEQSQRLRRSAYFRTLALTPPAAKEIRIFGLGHWVLDRFLGHWREAMEYVWKERAEGSRSMMLTVPGVFVVYAVSIGLMARSAVRGDMDLESLTICLSSVLQLLQVNVGPERQVEAGATTMPHLATLESETSAGEPRGERDPSGLPLRAICFEGVRFHYPGREDYVFDGLDLEIPAGRSLGIVGVNGAGKTTLVKLLSRLYDPTEGRLTVDGVDVREFDPDAWQRRVAAIFQDFVRYELPARANVGFGAYELAADDERLWEVARRAGVSAIVDGLEGGWETVLHREYKGGAELSGGQWQRIAIARALFAVAGGAGVLVLDEPTAALDVRSEAELFDRFLELTSGVTTILISHRFSTVRHADRICVLDAGRVVEQGSHAELIALGGRYAEMFHLQASRFADDQPALAGEGADG